MRDVVAAHDQLVDEGHGVRTTMITPEGCAVDLRSGGDPTLLEPLARLDPDAFMHGDVHFFWRADAAPWSCWAQR